MFRLLSTISIFLQTGLLVAGSLYSDSLSRVLQGPIHDTTRLHIYNDLAENIPDDDLWPFYNDSAYHLAGKLSKSTHPGIRKAGFRGLANALNNKGYLAHTFAQYNQALDYYMEAYRFAGDAGYEQGKAQILGNIGNLFDEQGEYDKAVDYYQKALGLQKRIKDAEGSSRTLNNLGYMYYKRGDISRALDYYRQSLLIKEKNGDERGRALTLINIASVYEQQGELENALEDYRKGLKIYKGVGDNEGLGIAHNNIAGIFRKWQLPDSAMYHFRQSLHFFKESHSPLDVGLSEINIAALLNQEGRFNEAAEILTKTLNSLDKDADPAVLSTGWNRLAFSYSRLGKTNEAYQAGLNSYRLAKQTGFPEEIKDAAGLLAQINYQKGNHKEAYNLLEEFHSMKDSLQNRENKRAALRQKFESEYERKHLADSILFAEEQKLVNARLEQQEAQLAFEETTRIALGGGIFLTLVLSGVSYRAYRQKKNDHRIISRQKAEVMQQKTLVEEKNREVLDSISYARRIQEAMLPAEDDIRRRLPESFILYLPKDIVAGDFYWVEENQGKIFFAVCDCTGHGVPGAMVSVVANTALHRAVIEFGLTRPGEILDKVNALVEERFSNSASAVRDGMDAVLCVLDQKTGQLEFSGAQNPLWIFSEGECREIKGDKQPIGKIDGRKNFITHRVDLQPGSSIYLFSDGFADQFGGEKSKKLKTGNFRSFLGKISNEKPEAQKELLADFLSEWKGNLEQVDDICVMGVKF